MADATILEPVLPASPGKPAAYRKLLRNPSVVFGATIIAIVLLMGLLAPWLGTIDPTAINPIARNKVPGGVLDADGLRRTHQDDRQVRHGQPRA